MSLHREFDENQIFSNIDPTVDNEVEDLPRKKRVRKLLEDKMERRRLKAELDDFDGELDAEFDWDEIKR